MAIRAVAAQDPAAFTHRIVVADPIAREGLDLLADSGSEVRLVAGVDGRDLARHLAGCDALIVGGGTRVDAALLDAAPDLRVIGRAGDGVDGIDVTQATRRGVLVINVPGTDVIAAAEHSFAMLLALARRLTTADASLKAGRWERSGLLGTELHGKTLGIVGLGRIGREIAARARAFGMSVIAHDPFLDPGLGAALGVALLDLDALLGASDVVTLHAPLTETTRNLLDAARLARLKRGALLVNCARGGLVDEAALLAALDEGRVGGAALDVFVGEPSPNAALVRHPRVLATPNLGAQTREAQQRASLAVVRMVLAALDGSLEVDAVNLPFRWRAGEDLSRLRLAEQLGRLAAGLLGVPLVRLEVAVWGAEGDHGDAVALAATRGALATATSTVNYVNSAAVAAERGVEVVRRTHGGAGEFARQVVVAASGGGDRVELTGAVFAHRRPRVVRIGQIPLEFRPEGRLLVLKTFDVPGVIGMIGTLLGGAGVNIADVHLARKDGEEDAWTVLRLDETPPPELLARLRDLPPARWVRLIDLDAVPPAF